MRTSHVLLLATLMAGTAGPLLAQTPYDASQLPATQGKVAQYSLTPRGDVDGLILDDGTEVHLPPHLGTQLVFVARPGDSVTIHGLRARSIPMVQAMAITNDATGASVTDSGPAGPPGPAGAMQPLTAQGQVKEALHGPQGEMNGVLLTDGTIVRLPPPEAMRLAGDLVPGAPLYVTGEGTAGPLGRVIEAQSIGPNQTQLAQIALTPPPPPRGGPGAPPPPPPGRL